MAADTADTKRRKSHHRVAMELGFLMVLLVLVGERAPKLKDAFLKMELASQDLRYEVRLSRQGPQRVDDVCIVGIDEASVRARTFPWDRQVYADFVRQMKGYGARAVMFDILFSEPRSPEGDAAFAAAMREAGNVFLACHALNGEAAEPEPLELTEWSYELPAPAPLVFQTLVAPMAPFVKSAAGGGHIMSQPDPDSKYRRAFFFVDSTASGKSYPHAAVDVSRFALGLERDEVTLDAQTGILHLGSQRAVDLDVGLRAVLNYPGGAGAVPTYSFVAVAEGKVPAETFRDRVVVVGATAPGLYDMKPQPLEKEVFYGVETNAVLIHNLLQGSFVHETSPAAAAVLSVLLGALIAIVVSRLAPIRGGFFALVVALIYVGLSFALFLSRSFMLETVPQLATMVLTFVTVLAYRLATEEREKKKIRNTFSLYVAPSIVEEILEDPRGLELDGQRREISILFSDIIGFTSMSEKLSAEEVKALLNEFFHVMNEIIFDHQGTIDKFIGDCIMVLFNAPMPQQDHAERAVRTALAMQRGLEALKQKWSSEGKEGFGIGVGINTGEAVVGNLGSPARLQYTAIGDHVNLASRLEGLTRNYDSDIIISKDTYEQVKDVVAARRLDEVQVKGRNEPVVIYGVDGLKEPGK